MDLIKKISQIPNIIKQSAIHKFEKKHYQSKIHPSGFDLSIHSATLKELKNTILTQLVHHKITLSVLSTDEQNLINQLKKKVTLANQNNVTRTNAYFQIYENHPELHWALLAHLVSRNGGWNMTDLQGGLTDVLTSERQKAFFMFLESANALIFYDAYPQLLLYEESKKQKKNLFHLLPHFHVSSFMKPIWDHFFISNESNLITVALIINEQHYIESRIIQNSYYKEHVLDTLLFQAQELFQMTQVLFPFQYKKKKTRLAGFSLADFASVYKRIQFGKKLYAMLFGISPLYDNIYTFAKENRHTGSRSDYWPTTFSTRNDDSTKGGTSCGLRERMYSPSLEDAWADVHHTFTNYRDWYSPGNSDVFSFFNQSDIPHSFDITADYCRSLQKLYVASLAYKKTEKWL
ncbi:DUF2515 family protein [Halalkalibacter alkalisediminis]|uniref:DUF2515 family protein n=1 Tax=Halalkalibacter alkalisediminis TaxID=935616 RepID=A0ABV6NBT3_9BACI|nr:DUF2515 family protein [Halalkalibacter alkalisediminis]